MTRWGVGTLTNWDNAGSGLYETSFVGSAYHLNCSFAIPDDNNLERAVGCLLMSAMPPSGVHGAVATLWKSYQFALEDAELEQPVEIYSLHRGVAVADNVADYW
jgi:hypothetical protein